jgi:hypothetical protein
MERSDDAARVVHRPGAKPEEVLVLGGTERQHSVAVLQRIAAQSFGAAAVSRVGHEEYVGQTGDEGVAAHSCFVGDSTHVSREARDEQQSAS